jgi:RNA-directed DNA polymerase
VRGFFLKNSSFALNEKVATVLAQIACFGHELPQGSPCSPIISDLIAHVLDVRLVRLAKAKKCTYTRYADDLTFSTGQKEFPAGLAYRSTKPGSDWHLGQELIHTIANANFKINNGKTRTQCRPNRQLVTGLRVNKKVNIRDEYYKNARAMCASFFKTGEYFWPGDPTVKFSSASKIEGALNHIYFQRQFRPKDES